MKHTPILKLQHYSDGQDDYIISAGDIKTADTIIKMCKPYGYRAKHIVHAVNMHSELVTALEECYSTINQLGYLSGDKLYQHNLTRIKEVLDKAERK